MLSMLGRSGGRQQIPVVGSKLSNAHLVSRVQLGGVHLSSPMPNAIVWGPMFVTNAMPQCVVWGPTSLGFMTVCVFQRVAERYVHAEDSILAKVLNFC